MQNFLLPYLKAIIVCAYSVQQNLEGVETISIWHSPYVELVRQLDIVIGVYAVFVTVTFLLNLIASWSHSRWCFLIILLLWLAPGLASVAGLHPAFAATPQQLWLGSGEPGNTLGAMLNYVFALLFGWSTVTILTNLSRAGERAKHAYDHLWYSLGITAGLFFVVTWRDANVRTELAKAESDFRLAADLLLSQVSVAEVRCATDRSGSHDDTTGAEFCEWVHALSIALYRRRYEPSFVRRFGADPNLQFFLTLRCSRTSSLQACAESRLAEVDSYNEHTCSDPTTAVLCRTVPETLNRDTRLASDPNLFFQHYALPIRPLAPTLSYTWEIASDMTEQSSAEKSEPHKRWLYFLGFAVLAGGKISFASASLFKDSRRSLATDSRSLISALSRSIVFIARGIRRLASAISRRGLRFNRVA